MQGMSFLIAEMLICLILAAIIGAIIGWLLRGSKIAQLNSRIEALEADHHHMKSDYDSLNIRYRDDLDEKDRTIAEYSSKLTLFESKNAERDAEITRLNADYSGRLNELEEEIDRLNYIREDLKVKDTKISRLESDLRQQQDVSAAIAKQANMSSEDVEALGGAKGSSWFNVFKNPQSGSTIESQVDDNDTPKWAAGIKSKLATGGAAIAGAAASRSAKSEGSSASSDSDSKSWVESAKERVKDATHNISEKAKEATHKVSEKAKDVSPKGSSDDADKASSAAKDSADSPSSSAKAKKTKSPAAASESSSKQKSEKSTSKSKTDNKDKKSSTAKAAAGAVAAAGVAATVTGAKAEGAKSKKSATKAKESATRSASSSTQKLSEAEQERVRQIRESRGVRIESAIFEGKPSDIDDLKEIYGIGPVMEGILNDLGIYSFSQLATLDEAQLSTLRDSIGTFRNRVDRDDWLGGARKCFTEKYGKSI